MERTLKILILLETLYFSSGVVNISGVEVSLEKLTNSFAEKETKIAQMIGLCDSYLMYSSSNIKASNVAGNFTSILDNGRLLLKNLKSINNHDSFESFADFPTCEYISSRQSSIEFDLSKFNSISLDVVANLTKIFQLRNQITTGFASNFKVLLKFKSKALTVIYTIREFGRTAQEFLNYLRQLDFGKINLEKLKIYLNAAATSSNCSATNSTFQESGKQIDVKLENFEAGLKGAHSVAIAKIQTALKTVTATTANQSSTLRLNLQDLLFTLKDTNTVSNYPNLKWPNLPESPREGIKLKLRTTVEKKREYFSIQDGCTSNKSRISIKRDAINAQNVSTAVKKVQVISSAVKDVVSSTLDVETCYDNYKLLLNTSIAQVEQIFNFLVENTTITSTTLVGSTTSDILSPQSETTSSTSVSTLTSTVPITTTSTSTSTVPITTTSTSTSTVPITTTSTSTSTVPITTTSISTSTSVTTTITPTTTATTTTTMAPNQPPPPNPTNTTTILGPCGTFIKYDPVNARTDPEMFGVPAGINFKDGTVQYVGLGKPNCDTMLICPGYISTKLGSAGCYMACQVSRTEVFDASTASYLAWHPKLAWINTTLSSLNSVPNALGFIQNTWNYKFARICSLNYVVFARIHSGTLTLRFMDSSGYNEFNSGANLNVQVLTCQP